eukprot:gnl/MRDRNA2_/MRDRNA2_128797_c0_seq1.p1 gnl/MRDRNA2_/MRDRNA2_128797_c0~~gnl/MRDRNA2_/MRDRNA2_128797_c0_seq1.p1  ORF type:complete len:190 (+),score=27.47 gnl/MRDRNA2_/MRDRNA2_128797_c0_seq1:98-667(+)
MIRKLAAALVVGILSSVLYSRRGNPDHVPQSQGDSITGSLIAAGPMTLEQILTLAAAYLGKTDEDIDKFGSVQAKQLRALVGDLTMLLNKEVVGELGGQKLAWPYDDSVAAFNKNLKSVSGARPQEWEAFLLVPGLATLLKKVIVDFRITDCKNFREFFKIFKWHVGESEGHKEICNEMARFCQWEWGR